MTFYLADPEQQLLVELGNPKIRQRDVASTYGLALRNPGDVNWQRVNAAIIDRWSLSGLKRIKAQAWKWHQEWLRGNRVETS